MSPAIRISDELYSRLERHAKGFDTPASVIERILNKYEGVEAPPKQAPESELLKKPDLKFHPADEKKFLKRLVEEKVAWVNIRHVDGTIKTETWYADRMRMTSNLRGNIWSGWLRDWKDKGIVKAEFYFDPKDFQR